MTQQRLGYWIRRLDDGGEDIEELARLLLESEEGQEVFDCDNEEEFIDRLYAHILGRDSEPSGVAYWARKLGSGYSKAQLLAFFAECRDAAPYSSKSADVFRPHP